MKTTRKHQRVVSLSKSANYSDIDSLAQYITEQGKILPKRVTGLNTKQQKKVAKSIKRARLLSLMPFINQ